MLNVSAHFLGATQRHTENGPPGQPVSQDGVPSKVLFRERKAVDIGVTL